MRKLFGLVVIALAVAGCKKEKNQSSGSNDLGPAERDGKALWKLAPAGTKGGVVIAAGTGAELHRGFMEVAKSVAATPMGGQAMAKMLAEAAQVGIDPTKPDAFKAIGIDVNLGAAVFFLSDDDDDVYAVFPVSDRAAFRKVAKGKDEQGVDVLKELVCAPKDGHYRCATTREKLAAWKPASKPVDDGWPGKLRGSIEFMVDGSLLAAAEPIREGMDQASMLRGAVRIQRGAVLAQVSVTGNAKPFLKIGATPLADAAKKRKPAGLLIGFGGALIELGRRDIGARINEPGPGGVTPGKLLDALTGELVAYAPAGDPTRGFVEIGINNPEPFKSLTPLCAMAPPIPGVAVTALNNGCKATLSPPTMPMPVEVTVEVKDKALVASMGDASAGRDGKGPALPGYIADHKWLGAVWLRGSVLGAVAEMPGGQLQQMLKEVPEAGIGLWAYAHLSELGMGFRTDDKGMHGFFRVATTWRNSPEIVAKLEPLFLRFSQGDMGAVKGLKELASKHKSSPLATDVSLGSSGGAIGGAAIGMMAAVAIPAFLKYIKKSKTSEARMFVKKLYDGARMFYLDPQVGSGLTPVEASFPAKSTAITPPLGSCCQGSEGKCTPEASLWTDETWVQLQFSMDDPHYYSYQYEVAPDGKSFTVRAFGDLDCDGDYSTFEMYGDSTAAPSAGMLKQNELE